MVFKIKLKLNLINLFNPFNDLISYFAPTINKLFIKTKNSTTLKKPFQLLN